MLKKIIIACLGLLALFLFSAVIVSKLYKRELNDYLVQAANKNMNAVVRFDDASISLIKHFPKLSIALEGLSIVGKDAFAKDTLANIEELNLRIDLYKYFFKDEIAIEKVKLNKATIKLVVLKDGKSNWDIVKTDSTAKIDSTEKQIHIALKKYEIINSDIAYEDAKRGFSTTIKNVNHEGSGDFTKDVFTLETNTVAEKLSISYLGKTYLSDVAASLKAPMQMNFKKMEFAFKNNDLVLNDLPLHFNAWFAMPDSNIKMDISFNANTSHLKDFLSLVPILYQNSFKELTASGNFTLSGFIKGEMTNTAMPGFGMQLKIENGAFKYQSIPAGIKNLYVQLAIDNPDGIVDHSVIQLQNLQMALNNQMIQGNMLVKNPSSNPYIKAALKGNLDIGALLKMVPQKDLRLTGNIHTDIQIDGTVNALKTGKGAAKGNFELNRFEYYNATVNKKMNIPHAQFNITPQKLMITDFNGQMGNSDVSATGSLENYIMYFLKNETITGKLNLASNKIDLDELMQLNGSQADTSQTTFELPQHVHFTTQAKISKIKYKDLSISDANGSVEFIDQQVHFNKLKFNLLDATFDINGVFSKQFNQLPNTQLAFKVQNLSIHKAYNSFSLIQKYAPIAEAAQGTMNVNISFESNFNKDMSPNINSLHSEGDLFINDLNLNGSNTVNKIVDLVKWTQFKTLEIKPVHLSYTISNGRCIIKPFDLITNNNKINIKGSNGLDQSIDYVISSHLPIQKMDNKGDINSTLNKVLQQVKVQVLVTGKMKSPTLQFNTASIAQDAKEIVKTEIKQQIDAKLIEAQKQADALLDAAKISSEKIRQEAYAKADQMIADTKNPFAQIGVKLVADKIKKEADKKADKILEDAKNKAQEIINNAKEKNQ